MKLNEEEKKAIEYFKKYINDEEKKLGKNLTTKFNEYLKVLLSQVDNQQKEIEELNKNKQQINYNEIFSPDFVKENFISKDKIRETLKKYDKDIAWANADDHYYFVKYINELLGEK